MPTIKKLRYLVAVADTLHFHRAAAAVNITQPTLSGQLHELEETLGVQLVERSRSRVVLTPIGKEIAARARQILTAVDDLVEVAKYDGAPFGGTIRLGVLPTVGAYLLPSLVGDLHRTYPYLKLYVQERLARNLLEGLEEGSLDALLMPVPTQGVGLATVPLFREPLWVIAPADHPLAQKQKIERTDLKGETVLALERGHRLHEQVRELCAQFGARLALDFEGTSLDTLRLMVGMGMGLAFMPALYIRTEIPKDDSVVARQLRNRPPSRDIGLVWRHQSARAAEFEVLADLFQRILVERVPDVTPIR
ncbi:MAG: hydrogen peroxide-inducible genes activator [Rhodospirillales bacterium]|nr:hydrogen peroxide-inducible genes activator [Rhodospirillales bacterium]